MGPCLRRSGGPTLPLQNRGALPLGYNDGSRLKVLLPFQVFADKTGVSRIVAETCDGSFGLLPHRLDCVAALMPGILTYETTSEGEVFVAVDEGVLVKTGPDVLVSVRRAMGGTDLGQLREARAIRKNSSAMWRCSSAVVMAYSCCPLGSRLSEAICNRLLRLFERLLSCSDVVAAQQLRVARTYGVRLP